MSNVIAKKTNTEMSTRLHLAVKNNDINEVINILSNVPDNDLKRIINASDVNGLSPLYIASLNGFSVMTQILLDKGAVVNSKDQHGRAPLHVAIKRPDYGQTTLKHCSDNNSGSNHSSMPTLSSSCFGNNVMAKAKALKTNVSSIRKPRGGPLYTDMKLHDEVVKILLEYGADVNSRDLFNNTPLHFAVHYGNENICKFLLKKGADVNARREDGGTPLYTAVERGHQKLVEILLQHCADVDLANKFLKTPLYISSHRVISKMLLDKGANADAREHYGRTPIHGLIERNTEDALDALDCIQVLLEYQANINAANIYGNTPLHSSVYCGSEDITKFLLENGADIQSKNQNGDSPLHVAVKRKYEKLVNILLEHSADVNSVNLHHQTPLHVSSHRIISKILLDKGADVDARENSGKTPFHIAIERNSLELLEVLLEYGADVNSMDKYGNTPLHCSADCGNDKIRMFLLENGADDYAKNHNGETALHVAVKSGNNEAVKVFSAYRGDIDALDDSGWTPLHIAVAHRKTKIVRFLLDNGAEVDAKDTYGTTPLHLAVECGYNDIVEILFEYSAHIDDRVFQRTLFTEHERTIITANIIKKHIVKLKALNVNMCYLYLNSIDFDDDMRDFCEDCEREVELMRCAINDETNVSFYDILSKSVRRVAIYTSNASIADACMNEVFKERFPIYSKMIRCKFLKGLKRAYLVETMSKAFDKLVNYQLTDNVTNEILSYLSVKDLLNIGKSLS